LCTLKGVRIGREEVGWLVGEFGELLILLSCLTAVDMRTLILLVYMHRLITLNGMKASEEIMEEQSRQVYTHTFVFCLHSCSICIPSGVMISLLSVISSEHPSHCSEGHVCLIPLRLYEHDLLFY
jgi:hypothetical protein